MPQAGCRGHIPKPHPTDTGGKSRVSPGQFHSQLCPVGLLWISIALTDVLEQQSGLMEFPLGKTHQEERVVPSAAGGSPVPFMESP